MMFFDRNMHAYEYVAFHDTDELFVPTHGSSLVDFLSRMEDKHDSNFTSINFRSRYFPMAKKYGKMPLPK